MLKEQMCGKQQMSLLLMRIASLKKRDQKKKQTTEKKKKSRINRSLICCVSHHMTGMIVDVCTLDLGIVMVSRPFSILAVILSAATSPGNSSFLAQKP